MELDFTNPDFWVKIGKIILIDLVLAGDNAVVIGMAASALPHELQKKAIFWGTFGAIALRLVLAFLLVEALAYIPALHLVAGVVLLWIAFKLVADDEEEPDIEKKDNLRSAIITIIIADGMMSIDNVLGVVAAAKGHFLLVLTGMLISVPIIVFSSALFARLIGRFPSILYAGGAVLGWVAGEMIVADDLVAPYVAGYELYVQAGCVLLVLLSVLSARLWKRRLEISQVTAILKKRIKKDE